MGFRMSFDLDGYVDVAERIRIFREKYPDGSLQPVNPENPLWVIEIGGKPFVCYAAAAFRSPDDPRPGIGIAWEPFPGPTQFTRDSEAMNAETAAWGRAIVASLAADTQKVASAQEVRNRGGSEAKGFDSSQPAATGASRAAAGRSSAPTKLATDKQKGFIGKLVDKTGMVPETWPLADDLSAAEASKIIDWLNGQPVEPPAERVKTLRKDADAAADEFVDDGRPF